MEYPHDLYVSDINKELWDLGFEMFKDRDKMVAKFIQADILDTGPGLGQLKSQISSFTCSTGKGRFR